MTDESIINLSDETKSSLRIYATMAGFFVITATVLYSIIAASSGQVISVRSVSNFSSIILLVIGVTLALLHKRDLFATFFVLLAFFNMLAALGLKGEIDIPIAIIFIVAALAFLQNRNEQAYIVSGLLLINACLFISMHFERFSLLSVFLGVLLIASCLYFAIALACEKHKLPLRDYLVADEAVPENDGIPVHFKVMGSSIGFLLISMHELSAALYRFGLLGNESFNGISGRSRSTLEF